MSRPLTETTAKRRGHILNIKYLIFSAFHFCLLHLKTYFLRCDPITFYRNIINNAEGENYGSKCITGMDYKIET